jgi:hypothetical protein
MNKKLALAVLIVLFLVGDAYGEDEVYYCVENGRSEISYDKKIGVYTQIHPKPQKFKLRYKSKSKSLELLNSDNSKLYLSQCKIFGVIKYESIECNYNGGKFTLNFQDGRFINFDHSFSRSLGVQYGKCDKF